jgi:Antitoxin Xre-like helix-turn-helix domain/Antitoxin Xre/MbcA/ParS C-terminal toxin-binding domain
MTNPARKARPSEQGPGTRALSAAGLRTFFNIAGAWGLNTDEQMVLLGSPGRSTFFKWKAAPEKAELRRDTLERLSYLLGIYKALQILLPDAGAADAWVKRPNAAPLFGGRTALERMLGGNVGDLVVVRQYLDARRGGWA